MSRFVCLAFLVLLAGYAVLAKPHEEITKEHAQAATQECKEEAGATDEDVETMMKHEPAETQEGKCLRACLMKKFDIMDDAGKFNKEHALELLKLYSKDAEKEAAGAEIVDKCVAIDVPEDHCDAAAAYVACIVEHMHEHGLSFEEH